MRSLDHMPYAALLQTGLQLPHGYLAGLLSILGETVLKSQQNYYGSAKAVSRSQ